MAIQQRRMTLEEFLRLPEEEPPLEYLDGEVTQKVSPQGQHGTLQPAIWWLFTDFAVPRRLARAFTELRATYAGGSPVPDVAVYRWDRVPLTPEGKVANVFREPPDIAVEIVSPDQSVPKIVEKCRWYVAHGVRIALLVDPDHLTVWLFRPDAEPAVLRGADRIDLDAVLPGFELTVDALFATLYHR